MSDVEALTFGEVVEHPKVTSWHKDEMNKRCIDEDSFFYKGRNSCSVMSCSC